MLLTAPLDGRTLAFRQLFKGLKMAMKQCPVCRMEQSSENQNCAACNAVFDDSPLGATPATEPEPETETDEETETE